MAISKVAESELVVGSAATSHNVTLPSGIDPGDLILLYVSTQESSDAGAPSTPSGYTQRWSVGHSSSFKPRITCVYKIATGSEDSSTATFTWGTSVEAHAVCLVLRAVDNGTPFDVAHTGPTSGASNPDPASITTVTDDAWVLGIVAANRASATPAVTISSGYTLAYSQVPDTRAFVIERLEKGTAGVENPGALTWATLDNSTTVTDAIRPFVGGSASLSLGMALSATGRAHLYGSASLSLGLTLSAAGTVALLGSASLSLGLALSAAGSLSSPASLSLGLALAATGRARTRGIVFVDQGETALLDGSWSIADPATARLFVGDTTAGLTDDERDALTESWFVEQSFTGYSGQPLTESGWSVTPGSPTIVEHDEITFEATSDLGSPVEVWGYYVTRDSDGRLMWFEVFVDAPASLESNGDSVSFSPRFTVL